MNLIYRIFFTKKPNKKYKRYLIFAKYLYKRQNKNILNLYAFLLFILCKETGLTIKKVTLQVNHKMGKKIKDVNTFCNESIKLLNHFDHKNFKIDSHSYAILIKNFARYSTLVLNSNKLKEKELEKYLEILEQSEVLFDSVRKIYVDNANDIIVFIKNILPIKY
jgi:hypothetical protein